MLCDGTGVIADLLTPGSKVKSGRVTPSVTILTTWIIQKIVTKLYELRH